MEVLYTKEGQIAAGRAQACFGKAVDMLRIASQSSAPFHEILSGSSEKVEFITKLECKVMVDDTRTIFTSLNSFYFLFDSPAII